MKKVRVPLRVNLQEGVPMELAMVAAGFRRPDLSDGILCGYLLVDGVERYHEARVPPDLAIVLEQKPSERVLEITLAFHCTYRDAELPCPPNQITKSSSMMRTSASSSAAGRPG